ncbi:SusC/RagA family TonB-linked outer membrane protein [Hymenobacter metallilatus]|uniref:TonB-dependent receptor n=1 Tax=Hymenobacter metallilatus TaxID=2493666 RepID=A0A3R9UJT1_9BACT|nr:TonB-dependent receptor [Hymenobacter metallilatus]RSK33267.1 TonB-dependent receptor [Hymenobacter metallilatus]
MKNSLPSVRRPMVPALLTCLPLLAPLLGQAHTLPPASATDGGVVWATTITGRVLDEKGQGMPGVTVLEKGTANGVTTDGDGRYSLSVADNATLVFSFVGYATQEVPVNGRSTVDVRLDVDSKVLNDVVVVGYLTQKREDVTGSVASVSGRDAQKAPVATIAEGIQGRLPGVQVINSGVPGQAPLVNIRGLGTVGSNSSPLYIIDGLWVDNIRDFNPADAESIQVLKDGASLAPYGSRGANGVIIITTRKGKSGTPAISFNAYGGVQKINKTYDLMNAQEWAVINRQAYENAGRPVQPFVANPPGVDTDWQKELIRTGAVQDYNLSFSGGGPNSNFLLSGEYFTQKGTTVGPKFERYSVRLNSGFNRGRLRVGENLQLARTNSTAINGLPFLDVLRMLPIIPVYDAANPGGFGFGNNNASTFGTNPIALQKLLNNTTENNRIQGNVYGELDIFSFLRYRLNLGTEYLAYHDREKRQYGQWRQNDPLNPSYYAENQGNSFFTMVENTLSFDKSFGKNNVTAVAGYTEQHQTNDFTRGRNNDYGTGPVYYWALDAGSSAPQVVGSSYTYNKRSYLGQVTYDFDQRYLLTGAVRRDGSSRFSPENRYGTFYAASAGWRVSQEQFFQNFTDNVSNLKLRASYGVLGNEQIGGPYGGAYRWQGVINPNVNYPFGGDNIQNGSVQTQLPSTDIAWEERRTANVGVDVGFLEDRITLSADYYRSETRNALVDPAIPIVLGNAGSNPYQRIGRIENRGLELVLGYNENRRDFKYSVTGNLTTIKNEVTRLSATERQNFFVGGPGESTRTEVGYELGSFYLYQFDGIFQTGDNIAGSAQPTARPGDVRYKDINNDGQITAADRTHIGRVFPKIQYGLNLTASYKGLDLSAFFQGVQGNDILNTGRYWLDRTDDNGNYRKDFSPWTPTNPSTTTPRAIIAGGGGQAGEAAINNSRLNSSRWLEDGSYLRLKNLQVGYTIPKTLTERVKGVGSLRVYVTAQNLFTVTDYTGYDPEVVSGNLSRGVDEGSYPNLRTVSLGLQLGL